MRMFRIAVSSRHGISGKRLRASGDNRRAASPIISNLRFTASYFSSFALKASGETPLVKRRIALAASRMSSRYASSFRINLGRRGEDGMFAVTVAAALDGAPAHQVHRAAKQLGQL